MDTTPLIPATSNSVKKNTSAVTTPEGKKAESSSAARLLILQNMVPLATNLVSSQLEAFSTRLADQLFKLSDQAVRPDEAKLSFDAHQLIKRNSTTFYRLVASQINTALTKEVSVFNTRKRAKKEDQYLDNTAQTYEEMEGKILLRNASHALEVLNAEPLVMLNTLIGRILNRMPIDVTQNPFRPEIFVKAVHQAWMELDPNPASHLLVLRLLQPTVFLQLSPILDDINQELMARGIRPEGDDAFDSSSGVSAYLPVQKSFSLDPYLQDKLKRVFSGQIELAYTDPHYELSGLAMVSDTLTNQLDDLDANEEHPDKASIDQQFFEDLRNMQKHHSQEETTNTHFESRLHKVLHASSAQKLSVVERNTIELLARIFDYIFADPSLGNDIKSMMVQLQIPIVRVALSDRDFFFRESHPARTLLDMLGSSGILLDAESASVDPLLGVIGDVIERVQSEFDQHIELFSDVVSDLESYLKEEELKAQAAISQPVQTALSEEKMRVSRELAEHDVAIRVETGEVAGFLEVFLEEQWIRILTIAHSVKEEKPHALENALKTMDDLIWSLKPKNSPEERKELIAKLPAMLTLLNAWLNAIRWDEPDRVLFFSKLAERHAAMARAPLELSPRRQLEIAVNIAQRASNRRLDRFVQEKVAQTDDEATKQVAALERGMWLDFNDEDEQITRYKLAWISPKRSSFIFASRQGDQAFSISIADLEARYRSGTVNTIQANSLVDRALTYALKDLAV
ncbi:DUF1631 family protein [Undibacterium flavidum]|uniref:DUF1631 family protein n=1 Tax=Undibacterium flavidum TaxID=2762297 RepID=A0ABR6YGI0_9BURK|nr:DUF1631 family protein [Undibacterium flavidum]MBC3875612.1 DUF1631 family protein [Undibacterium flavidum]